MMRSLFSGVAGLKTHQTKMDVIGNNIANVNTVAFKYSSTSFQDIMYQTMSGASGATATKGGKNPNQIGLGVTTGATKVTITKGGAAQSTGDALDIRLSDSNSTNFFIVNNGTQNVFTRSGSFYVDGNGNLAMTSTGYLVQGWQVDKNTGTIARDTVSSLKIMSPENMTSEPEKTEESTISGVLDKNDTNVTSTDGYATTLVLYDELGYSYTARFSIKSGLDEITKEAGSNNAVTSKSGYTIKLTNLYSNSQKDAAGNPIDILAQYLTNSEAGATDAATKTKNRNQALANIFGHVKEDTGEPDGKQTDSFKLNAPTFALQGTEIAYTYGGETYYATVDKVVEAAGGADATARNVTFTTKPTTGTAKTRPVPVTDIFKGFDASLQDYTKSGTAVTYKFDEASMMLKATYDAVNYNIMFNAADGTFSSVGATQDNTPGGVSVDGATITGQVTGGGDSVVLHLGVLGPNFADVNIDFTQMKNFNNGGSSTVGMDTGTVMDKSYKAGKKLGAMTGISVQQDGKIFGSYDNGNTVLLGQIAVAQFANASGLEELGNNCYGTTLNSGTFDGIGVEVTADGGSMNTGQLEMSNVDLSTEFTEMITTQRGFQANSRIITVSDTLLEELTNLKR